MVFRTGSWSRSKAGCDHWYSSAKSLTSKRCEMFWPLSGRTMEFATKNRNFSFSSSRRSAECLRNCCLRSKSRSANPAEMTTQNTPASGSASFKSQRWSSSTVAERTLSTVKKITLCESEADVSSKRRYSSGIELVSDDRKTNVRGDWRVALPAMLMNSSMLKGCRWRAVLSSRLPWRHISITPMSRAPMRTGIQPPCANLTISEPKRLAAIKRNSVR